MHKYNGLLSVPVSTLLAAALVAGCASDPEKKTYSVDVPAETQGSAAPQENSAPPVAESAAPAVRSEAPLRYVVKKGDTLWDISNHFLLDAWQWPEIWYVNDQVRNPHLIYPGDVLELRYINGKPAIAQNGSLERMGPRVRDQALGDAVPAIPIEAIRDFLGSPRIVTPDELKRAPYIVAFTEPGLLGGAGSRAYVKNLEVTDDADYSLVRLGKKIIDPDNGRSLGWEAIPVGEAEVRDYGSISTVGLVKTVRESRAGDRLIAAEEEIFDPFFYPKAPARGISGRIISVYDGLTQIGQYAVVSINRGSDDGLARGDVLNIMQTGRVAKDPYSAFGSNIRLPDQQAGSVMVFKVTPQVSYALVMTATRAAHAKDRVVSPTSSLR